MFQTEFVLDFITVIGLVISAVGARINPRGAEIGCEYSNDF
jgi:hypothetical protein